MAGGQEVARLVGRDRSTVANTLRLLKLPRTVQALVHEGSLSEGHARALLGVENESLRERLAKDAVTGGWSVREMESRVRGAAPTARRSTPAATRPLPPDAQRVQDALRERLATDVKVTAKRRGRGHVSISYYSNDDLSRLLEIILGRPFDG